MFSEKEKKDLEKQGYRFAGKHSAVKICDWCKKSLTEKGECYKARFYGIKSHRCVQMAPGFFCTHRCVFCWRDTSYANKKWQGTTDSPKQIVDACIEQHKKLLLGFKGNPKARAKYREASQPLHFAISLTGEPTMYPKLPLLVEELKKRKMTSFIVTNGTNPAMIKKLLKHQPTQLYITLPAPDEETYLKTCSPVLKDGWKRIMQSLALLNKFKRNAVRLTLAKGVNMHNPDGYAKIIKNTEPLFVELKAYMHVGYSRERLSRENMPLHSEIVQFAEQLARKSGYKIIDEKKESRVVLLMKKDTKDRIMRFQAHQ